MKTRLFLAALCLFLAPLCFTSSSSQFSAYACGYVVAFDGELIPCECDEPGCTGGTCGGALRINPDDNAATVSRSVPTNSGSEILFAIAAALLIWRLRV